MDPAPAFTAASSSGCNGDPIAAYDIDHDGKLDAVFAEAFGRICVLLNTTVAGEPASFQSVVVARARYSPLFGIPDVNRDGQPDIVGDDAA